VTPSQGVTPREKKNLVGKMVKKYWGGKWLKKVSGKKVSGKFCVKYVFVQKAKKSSEMFGMNSIFECKRLNIAKFFTLTRSQIWRARRLPPRVTPTLTTPLP